MSDWSFCQDSLLKLSRTFALPISMLPARLEKVVTCGYLLCRIADTVEDRADLALPDRDRLYQALLAVLEHGEPASVFTELYHSIGGAQNEEAALALGLGRVLNVLKEGTPKEQEACLRWVAELTRGMAIYSHRAPQDDGFNTLLSIEDLERYCYFVAGTVGQMLTELFIENLPELTSEHATTLRRNAEAFGMGLQLVNIIKDMSEDFERRWSFIPRTTWEEQGIGAAQILDPEHRRAAHRAIAPVFARARQGLDQAFAYTLALPREQTEIRLFCLVPLWLAVATLRRCQGNDELFVAGRKVKITRDEVAALVQECHAHVGDDAALERLYRAMRAPESASAVSAA